MDLSQATLTGCQSGSRTCGVLSDPTAVGRVAARKMVLSGRRGSLLDELPRPPNWTEEALVPSVRLLVPLAYEPRSAEVVALEAPFPTDASTVSRYTGDCEHLSALRMVCEVEVKQVLWLVEDSPCL